MAYDDSFYIGNSIAPFILTPMFVCVTTYEPPPIGEYNVFFGGVNVTWQGDPNVTWQGV